MHDCFLPTCGGNTARIMLGISIARMLACFPLYMRHVLEEYLAASCSFPSHVFACHVLSARTCLFSAHSVWVKLCETRMCHRARVQSTLIPFAYMCVCHCTRRVHDIPQVGIYASFSYLWVHWYWKGSWHRCSAMMAPFPLRIVLGIYSVFNSILFSFPMSE